MDEIELPLGRPFLTAEWANLIIANFPAPEALLAPWLPDGLELDRLDGRAWVSLVAFNFLKTRVLGVPWPGYRNFPEINLRFYVRHGSERGVVFIREFVPKRLVAGAARMLYREPYAFARMSCTTCETSDEITIEHKLTVSGTTHTIRATGARPAEPPALEGRAHFFKEHQWGYGRSRRGHTLRFRVRHPLWGIYPIRSSAIEVEWGQLFGAEWSKYSGAEPESALIAVGSPVEVYPRCRIIEPGSLSRRSQPLADPLPG
jgi:uncharacterized protein YqjF (DUF2071 family)